MANLAGNPLPLDDNEGGALNLTRVTGLGAALVVVLTAFEDKWDVILGDRPPGWARSVVIVGVIAAFAIVAAADMLARGYAAGRRGELVPMPDGVTGTIDVPTGPNPPVAIVAARFHATEDGKAEFLVVKEDKSTAWIASGKVNFG
jgi:hypothetical protein